MLLLLCHTNWYFSRQSINNGSLNWKRERERERERENSTYTNSSIMISIEYVTCFTIWFIILKFVLYIHFYFSQNHFLPEIRKQWKQTLTGARWKKYNLKPGSGRRLGSSLPSDRRHCQRTQCLADCEFESWPCSIDFHWHTTLLSLLPRGGGLGKHIL